MIARDLSEKAVFPAGDIHLVMGAGKGRFVVFVFFPVDFPRTFEEFRKRHRQPGCGPLMAAFAAAHAQNMAVGPLGEFAMFAADDGYFFSPSMISPTFE
jgi:hypothetical protein